MPASRKIVGYEGKFYFSTASGAPVAKLAHFSGYELNIKADDIDASDHDNNGWKDKLDGMREWDATIDQVTFANDASQESMITAMLTGGVDILCAFRPIDATGEEQYLGTARITSFRETAKMSTAQARNVTLSGRGALTRGTIPSSS